MEKCISLVRWCKKRWSKSIEFYQWDLKIIFEAMFSSCSSLENITIPSSVTQISCCAFKDCKSLKKITIPSSVRNLGFDCFEGCSSLMQITIPSSLINEEIGLNSKAKII